MKREVMSHARYKNAFNCKKCPQSDDENGCPMWWSQVWTDSVNGEQRAVDGCGYVMLPHTVINMVRSTNKAAGEISAMKEEVAENVGKATVRILQLYGAEAERLGPGEVAGHNEQYECLDNEEGSEGV